MKDLGNKLKQERETRGVSQREISIELGVKQNTISQYENNIKRPSYEILVGYAKYFHVTTDYLLGLED